MPDRELLPFGSTYYSIATCYDHYGNKIAYRVNTWHVGYGMLPDNYRYQTEEGFIEVKFYQTEDELREALYPTVKPVKKHRLAKALILSVAALSGMLDEQDFDVVGY